MKAESDPPPLDAAAESLSHWLSERGTAKIVLAESCTGGLAAAALAAHSGISRFLCGSAVVYRDACKQQWLGVTPLSLLRHTAVSPAVTEEMAIGVLRTTEEADWSAAVTGHLGPEAPADVDGAVFIAVARRVGATPLVVRRSEHRLNATARSDRQREAAARTLHELLAALTRWSQSDA